MGIGALVGAGISGAASLFGASNSAKAAKQSAQIQAAATDRSIAAQQGMFNTAQNNLAPFLAVGGQAAGALGGRLNEFSSDVPLPPAMTQSDLEATPGYQFTLGQGLKAVQNSAAARGLGLSGAALKGAATYATGLSDQTYNTRFGQGQQLWQDAVTNKQNNFNRLYQTAGIGSSAASGAFPSTVAAGQGIGSTAMTGAQGQAAATMGEANAWSNGLTGLANAFTGANNMLMLRGGYGGMFGGSGGGIPTMAQGGYGPDMPRGWGSFYG